MSTVDKSVEVQLAAIRAALEAHTSQDMSQFTAIFAKLGELDGKLDALLIREARKEGEFVGMKRSAAALAAFISFIVSVASVVAQAYLP